MDTVGEGGVARLSLDMLDALGGSSQLRLWSAEQPHLYTLVLELRDSDGGVLEYESCQVRGCGQTLLL